MMKRLVTYIRQDMKLIYKVLLIVLLTVLIPAVVTILVFYNWFYQNTVETVLESRLIAVGTAEARIEDTVEKLREVAEIVSSSELLQMALTMDEEELQTIFEDEDETSDDWLDTFKAILSSRLDDEDIKSICIYCDEETELMNQIGNQFSDTNFFVPLSEIEYNYWKTILEITGESSGLFPGFYLSSQERSVYGGTAYVQKVQYSRQGEWKTAYVAVYCEESNIVGILQEYGTMEGELAYVIDSRNVIVTPYEEDFVLYIEDYETLEEAFPEEKTFYTRSYGGENVYACRYEVDSLDWALIWVIPESAIAGESRTFLVSAFGTYGLFLILGIAAAWWVSWTILGRIYQLREQMQNVKTGHPAVLEGETGKDEIGELIRTYNYMVNQIDESVTREMQAQEEMNEMRLEILRAQIDPHFLYNTLDLLRGLSQKGEKQKVEELVLALTQFYRLALNRGEKFSTVEREILQSESYMKIMNMRFGDQLNFVVDVADEILEYYVPVLIFQPILENAIIHGILEKEVPCGNISLTGWREGDDLVFLISDDGVGIDEETMKAILEGRKTSGKGSNIGAYNTARRLQLIYGEKEREENGEGNSKKRSGLSYHSEPGCGTDVEIRVPVTKEEDVQ